ncbi:hypothetical protein, partial [Burkholderia pseudomallei]|uniref:hypothetical protein n=1 Tax=Burkholderia pseudomallei TaxID=28450 RepID=UPI0021F74EA5
STSIARHDPSHARQPNSSPAVVHFVRVGTRLIKVSQANEIRPVLSPSAAATFVVYPCLARLDHRRDAGVKHQ